MAAPSCAPFGALNMPDTPMLVRPALENSEYGDDYGEPYTITHVRYDELAQLERRTMGGEPSGHTVTDQPRGTIYVDATASGGASAVPVRSLVSVGGGPWMTVTRCACLRDFAGRVHHWELEVR